MNAAYAIEFGTKLGYGGHMKSFKVGRQHCQQLEGKALSV